MNFETMVGTTGIASDGETLFIANNKVITMIDALNKRTDITHDYQRIEDITVSGKFLAGICVKDNRYGVFLFDLTNSSFTTRADFAYEPYKIFLYTNANEIKIKVMDNAFTFHVYEVQINVGVMKELAAEPGKEQLYDMVDYAETDTGNVYMSDFEIKKGNLDSENLITSDFLAIQNYLQYLFIFYKSHFNMYSVSQYDLSNNTMLREIECGYLSTDIYTCIHRKSLYISSTLNKIIPLTKFSVKFDELVQEEENKFLPLFELNSITPDLIRDELKVDLTKIQERKDSLVIDTKAVEANHSYYYGLVGILVCLAILIGLSFTSYANTANRLILLILVVSIVFIIRSYI